MSSSGPSRTTYPKFTDMKPNYEQLKVEFNACIKLWDASGDEKEEEPTNDEKLAIMFGGIPNKVKLDRGIFLSLAGFSKVTRSIEEKGAEPQREPNPSLLRLVFLYKVLPMLSKTPFEKIYFHDPNFNEVEKEFLEKIPFPHVKEVVILPDSAQALMTSKTFFLAIIDFYSELSVASYLSAGFPGLYISRLANQLNDRGDFEKCSIKIKKEEIDEACWTDEFESDVRYLKANMLI